MPNEFYQTVLKSFIAAAVFFALIWLPGKKKMSDLSLFQFAAVVAVGCIAALFAMGAGTLQGLTAILVFALVIFLIAFIPARIRQERSWKTSGFKPAGRLAKSESPLAFPGHRSGLNPRRGLALNIIVGGRFIQEHLSIAHKDINWILDELTSRNIHVHDVLLAYFDCDDEFFVHVYGNQATVNP